MIKKAGLHYYNFRANRYARKIAKAKEPFKKEIYKLKYWHYFNKGVNLLK